MEKRAELLVGDVAPDFTLPDQYGDYHKLSDARPRGIWVLLYLYEKDGTRRMMRDTCMMRDNFSKFAEFGAQVYGVSPDTPEHHKFFLKRYNLPFSLLVDEGADVAKVYGAWQTKRFLDIPLGHAVRTMGFLVDPEGRLVKIYNRLNVERDLETILTDLKELREMWTTHVRTFAG